MSLVQYARDAAGTCPAMKWGERPMDELRQTQDLRGYPPDDRSGFEADERRHGGLRRVALLSTLVVVLVGFAGIVWYAYDQYRISVGDGQAPLIRADADPVRIRPEDPGGLEVPHRDRLVLQEPGQSEADGGVGDAVVQPPPEEPLARPDVADAGALSSASLPVFATDPSAGGSGARPSATGTFADAPEALIARGGESEMDASSPGAAPTPMATAVGNVAVGLITGDARPVASAPPFRLARAEPFGRQPPGPAGLIEIAEMSVGLTPLRRPRAAAPTEGPETAAPQQAAALPPDTPLETPPEALPDAAVEPTVDAQVEPVVEAPAPPSDAGSAPPDAIAALLQRPADEPVAPPDRTYKIQLAAVNSDEAARTGWQEFRGSYPDLLGDLELFVQVVEVNGRTYHRIQGGMLDRDGARTVCRELRDRGTDCIVRP